MANENVKNLSQKMIQDEYSKYKETVEIDFDENGQTYRVNLHPYFKPENINNVLTNVGKDLDEIHKNDIDFPDEMTTLLILYHTLVEFSDFPTSKSKDIKKRVSFFTQVINTHYFEACVNTFVEEEINKVFDKAMEVLNVSEQLTNVMDKNKEAIENLDLESPEVYQRVHNTSESDEESDDGDVSQEH